MKNNIKTNWNRLLNHESREILTILKSLSQDVPFPVYNPCDTSLSSTQMLEELDWIKYTEYYAYGEIYGDFTLTAKGRDVCEHIHFKKTD